MKTSISGQIAKDLLKRFPNSPILTLAKKLYKENPKVYKNVEHARGIIRVYIGQAKPHQVKNKEHFKEKTFNYNPFKLPDTWYEPPREHVLPIGCKRILWLSDIQNPFLCKRSVETAFEYGIKKSVQAVILNGDIFDHYATSRHDKDPRKINWKEEKSRNISLIESVRSAFPNAVIWFKDGNHEKNKLKYMMVKAPEIYDEDCHNIAEFYQLDKYRIKSITGNDTIRVGDLTGWHGDEFLGNGGNVNPAKSYFDKVRTSLVVSHVHKSSSYITQDYYGKVFKAYTIGCLCGLKPKWLAINQWNNGFGYEEVSNGESNFENWRIDGKKLIIV
jgi:hypothetical protein